MIKIATIEDIAIIRNIAYNTWPSTFGEILTKEQIAYMLDMMYAEEVLKNHIQNGTQTFLIYVDENEPQGFAAYEAMPHNGKLKIHKIYLLPSSQGKGIGKKLFSYLEQTAKDLNLLRTSLNVNKYNKAIHFYNKLGYQTVKTEIIDIGHGFIMDDFVMEKILN